jgi:hypothetical protein
MLGYKGWFVAIPLLFGITVSNGQTIRYSGFYDLNNGAGGLLSVIHLGGDTLMAVGSSLNLTTNSGYSEGHHVVVSPDGSLLYEHEHSELEKSHKPQSVIRSSYSDAIYSSGYHCDYTVESSGYCDFYFSKLSNTGDTLFTRIIERPDTSDFLLDMVETTSNTILLMGWTYDNPAETNADLLFISVDSLGNEINRVVWGGVATDFVGSGVVVDALGNVMMTGYTKSFPAQSNGRTWVVKTDSIGNLKWYRTYSGVSGISSSAARIAVLPDGNMLVAGGNSGFGIGTFGGDGSLMMVDTAGNEICGLATKKWTVG